MDQQALSLLISALNLPKKQWVVFGGACLTARGIRNTSDLELFVTPTLYEKLKRSGWKEGITISTGAAYITCIFDGIPVFAFITCGSDKWRPDAESYIKNPEVIGGAPFMPLSEMYLWKVITARAKDLEDVKLIDTYLAAPGRDRTGTKKVHQQG